MLLKANKYRKDKKADCRQNELGSRIFVGRVFVDYAKCLHFYPSFSYGRIIAGERPDAFLRLAVHFCPQCGQFRGIKMALFCGCQKWNDAVIAQKPQNASKIKDNFDAITILGGFEHENRRTKPPHRLDGRCGLAAGAGTLQKRRMQHAERIHCKGDSVYCGYLQSEYAGDFLPKILGETLEAILSMFGDRIGKLLLKQAVEQNICNHILASDTDIDAATYQKMRGMSYQEVLRTNGQISFPEVLRQQKRL